MTVTVEPARDAGSVRAELRFVKEVLEVFALANDCLRWRQEPDGRTIFYVEGHGHFDPPVELISSLDDVQLLRECREDIEEVGSSPAFLDWLYIARKRRVRPSDMDYLDLGITRLLIAAAPPAKKGA